MSGNIFDNAWFIFSHFTYGIAAFLCLILTLKELYKKSTIVKESKSLGKLIYGLRRSNTLRDVLTFLPLMAFAYIFFVSPSFPVWEYLVIVIMLDIDEFFLDSLVQIRERGFVCNNERILLWRDIVKVKMTLTSENKTIISVYTKEEECLKGTYCLIPSSKTSAIVKSIQECTAVEVIV